MSDQFKGQGTWAYENRPAWSRRKLLNGGADHAEWNVPEGRIGGLIRQQRRRAHQAIFRSKWLFALLFAVVLAALGYYVALPIWQQIQDANKLVAESRAQALNDQLTAMDEARNGHWADLVSSLRLVVRPFTGEVPDLETTSFYTANDATRLVVMSRDGEIGYTDDAGRSWQYTDIPLGDSFVLLDTENLELSKDTKSLLVFSRSATSARFGFDSSFPAYVSRDAGSTWSIATSPDITTDLGELRLSKLDDETLFVSGLRRAFRSDDFGATWIEIDYGLSKPNEIFVSSADDLIFAESSGRTELSISEDEGKTWRPVPLPFDLSRGAFLNITQEKIQSSGLRASGGEELYFETSDFGQTWQSIEFSDTAPPVVVIEDPIVFDITLSSGSFSIESNGSTVRIFKDQEDSFQELVESFPGWSEISNRFFWSDETTAVFPMGRDDGEIGFAGTWDGGVTWQLLPKTQSSDNGWGPLGIVKAANDFTLLMPGDDGTYRTVDDLFHAKLAPVTLAPGAAGDTQATSVLAGLQPPLPDSENVAGSRQALEQAVIPRQQTLDALQTEEALARSIAGSGVSPDQRRRDFEAFVQTCADVSAESVDCAQTYINLRQSEEKSVWEFAAEKAPQAVLLLFLLATLNGLYRYNLRIAGFHHSRADALEMLSLLHEDPSKIGKDDLVAFTALADQMAADKVEFGKASSPTDQAVELARVITQRS